VIEAYEFGRITIDGRDYTHDLIIHPQRVDDTWWRAQGHRVTLADLETALADNPEVVIIGTGYSGLMQVDQGLRAHLESQHIRLIAAPTIEAWQRYNELAAINRVVAALHLTC
jgi:hypothetical protein